MFIHFSTGDTLTIADWNTTYSTRIENVSFADGTQWNAADVLANLTIVGTEGDDSVYNKHVKYGSSYETGLGDDDIYGSRGNDTYIFNLGDGNDVIKDDAGSDTLQFGSEVTTGNIWFSQDGDDLKLQILGHNDQVTIANWYSDQNRKIEGVVIGGESISNQELEQLVIAMATYDAPQGDEISNEVYSAVYQTLDLV